MRPLFVRWLVVFLSICSLCSFGLNAADALPARVSVMPIAFVPNDQPRPTTTEKATFLKHIRWAQRRYAELLDGDTFMLAKSKVEVVPGRRSLDEYGNASERGAPDLVSELLDHFDVSRFENPYVFCIMFMNSKDSFPEGGGRTINGGLNGGGGMLHIASGELARNRHYQTTLQHELGHAFGLPHVDVYGYDMKANDSLMSYNPAHFTNRFEPSRSPGKLIPEDRRALAMNDRVFTRTTFDPQKHVPAGYSLSERIVPLGPMELPRHPDFYPKVTTTAGEDVRSKVINIVRERIKPSTGPGITYDPNTMWHSKPLDDGVAVLDFEFPITVRLSALAIHSQHSGIDHHATAMKFEVRDGVRRTVADKPLTSIDETVNFGATSGKKWRLTLTSGPSRILVIRGLRFLDGNTEPFPHMVPYVSSDDARGAASN